MKTNEKEREKILKDIIPVIKKYDRMKTTLCRVLPELKENKYRLDLIAGDYIREGIIATCLSYDLPFIG